MITKEKLATNLKVLKNRMPIKPTVYTSDHPRTIREALTLYCNQRTVHTVQSCTINLNEQNWPFPLWFNHENVRVGFFNNILYRKHYKAFHKGKKLKKFRDFEVFHVPFWLHFHFKKTYDEILTEAFQANFRYAFDMILSNPLLQTKRVIIESVKRSYRRKDWIACISTLFPLIDFVTRKILKTNNLKIDVSKICKLFEQNGFSKDTAGELMPYFTYITVRQPGEPVFNEERDQWFKKMSEYDFGLIGPALSSFIRFANIYYSYFKEDSDQELALINRHAILHGSINNFGSSANTVKLFTFLYLMLELEPIFKILFAE